MKNFLLGILTAIALPLMVLYMGYSIMCVGYIKGILWNLGVPTQYTFVINKELVSHLSQDKKNSYLQFVCGDSTIHAKNSLKMMKKHQSSFL